MYGLLTFVTNFIIDFITDFYLVKDSLKVDFISVDFERKIGKRHKSREKSLMKEENLMKKENFFRRYFFQRKFSF